MPFTAEQHHDDGPGLLARRGHPGAAQGGGRGGSDQTCETEADDDGGQLMQVGSGYMLLRRTEPLCPSRTLLLSFPPFASFLPGIAGPLGIPLCGSTSTVTRRHRQLGVGSKDMPIMEFQPADERLPDRAVRRGSHLHRAPQAAPADQVLRTVLGLGTAATGHPPDVHRPQRDRAGGGPRPSPGPAGQCPLWPLPGEPFAGLVRQVTVQNVSGTPSPWRSWTGCPSSSLAASTIRC